MNFIIPNYQDTMFKKTMFEKINVHFSKLKCVKKLIIEKNVFERRLIFKCKVLNSPKWPTQNPSKLFNKYVYLMYKDIQLWSFVTGH